MLPNFNYLDNPDLVWTILGPSPAPGPQCASLYRLLGKSATVAVKDAVSLKSQTLHPIAQEHLHITCKEFYLKFVEILERGSPPKLWGNKYSSNQVAKVFSFAASFVPQSILRLAKERPDFSKSFLMEWLVPRLLRDDLIDQCTGQILAKGDDPRLSKHIDTFTRRFHRKTKRPRYSCLQRSDEIVMDKNTLRKSATMSRKPARHNGPLGDDLTQLGFWIYQHLESIQGCHFCADKGTIETCFLDRETLRKLYDIITVATPTSDWTQQKKERWIILAGTHCKAGLGCDEDLSIV